MRGEHEGRLRVVLDTNVLVSALAFAGTTAWVWEGAQESVFDPFISPFILVELRRNLIAKGRLPPEEADDLIKQVRTHAREVHPSPSISVVARKDSDNRILECALAAGADVLVTGNMPDLKSLGEFRGIRILTPREFLLLYLS